jgi:hypothetical protein
MINTYRRALVSALLGLLATFIITSSAAAATTTAGAATAARTASAQSSTTSTAVLEAAHPTRTITLSASRSAGTVTVEVQSAGAATTVLTLHTSAITPDKVQCYFPTCGWQFSKAQTKALAAAGTAAALAACHRYLSPVGLQGLCTAVVAWILAHVGPGATQCLYVSTLPPGVIKYVSC